MEQVRVKVIIIDNEAVLLELTVRLDNGVEAFYPITLKKDEQLVANIDETVVFTTLRDDDA